VTCNNVDAQTLESITQQRKLLEGGPQIIVGSSPADIKVNIHTNKIYVANRESDSVSVIDSNSGNTKTIRVGVEPRAIAVDGTSNKIYVVNERSNTVSVIDGYNDTKVLDIPVGRGPSAIAVDSIDNKIYVANQFSDTVSVINGYNYTKEHDIPIREPSAIALGYQDIFIANQDTVSVIDRYNYTKEHDLPVGEGPSAIALGGGVDNPNGKIYVANQLSNTVSVINGHDYTKEHEIPVGGAPSAIGYDQIYDKIYVANIVSNTVSVIDGHNDNHTNDIPVGREPRAIGVDVITHLIYVANEHSNTISVIHVSVNPPHVDFSYKVAAGIIFNVNPANSGTIICNNASYPTNIYLYVDSGTSCTAQPYNNTDLQINNWVESPLTNRNSSIPLQSTGNLTVNRYGIFTANFKPIPPPDILVVTLFSVIATAFIGSWTFIGSAVGRRI